MCFCSKIDFHVHVSSTFSQYIKLMVLVRGLTFALSSFECLLLYFTLVEPKLEYASVVWNSVLSTEVNKLGRIQQKFAALSSNIFFPHVYYSYVYALVDSKLRAP
jgi:hypothetical protein